MAISINWATKVITIPQADLTFISGSLYELDVDIFRLALKDIEDSEDGMSFPDTHRHNTEVTLGGVTYARTFEIINGYTVTFQDVGSPYRVRCTGANHNISDVQNLNNVSIIVGNAAGLIVKSIGSGLSTQEHDELFAIRGVDGDDLKDISDQIDVAQIDLDFMEAVIKNKKLLSKEGSTWYLIIKNASESADIVKKALKDKTGADISDLEAGMLAQEFASTI